MVLKVLGDIVKLSKFYGLKKEEFLLHLKECEFRFNHRKQNLYKILLEIIFKY